MPGIIPEHLKTRKCYNELALRLAFGSTSSPQAAERYRIFFVFDFALEERKVENTRS
jgi:hypothetical protein